LFLTLLGPISLVYIPSKLFVHGNPSATANNIATHEGLFRLGMVTDLAGAVALVFLVLALYQLFKGVDNNLAVLVVIVGGIMPAVLYFVNVVSDAGALMAVRGDFLSVFDKPQRDALVMLFLHLHDEQNTAAELLWGLWLFPLAALTYKSRFLPRLLGVWLFINGLAYVVLWLVGTLVPQYQDAAFAYSQPALFGEVAFMLWLVIRGARPQAAQPISSAS